MARISDSRKILDRSMQQMRDLANELTAGRIDIGAWQGRMRELLREQYALQLIAGAGGDRSKVANEDWLRLGGELRSQYLYLERFGRDIQEGKMSPAQIAMRAAMYAQSSKQMYFAQASPVELPANPGDGSTPCRVACRCRWELRRIRQNGQVVAIHAYWRLGKAEHCPGCVARANRWNPLIIPFAEN